MRNRRNRNSNSSGSIDMSSLMDIIFILLIFVMISISFQQKFTSMELDLPISGSEKTAEKSELEIALRSDGKLFLQTKEIKTEDLQVFLTKEGNAKKSFLFNVEKKVYYEDFLRITEILKDAGVGKVNLGLKEK